ncbi:MAG: YciI family protein [Actinomycetota bacterium]
MASPETASGFLLISRYTAPREQIEALVPAHREYLQAQFASGLFVVSGRRVPWTGGVIVARGTREQVDAAVAADPFTIEGAAETEIVEFQPLFGSL